MKAIRCFCAAFLLFLSPAVHADFQYTETSQLTGGALLKMMKVASVFARGDAKRQEKEALAPTSTTHYIKGNRLRIDNADGTAQIIDLDGRRVIAIDLNKKTYAVATFEQIKAAMEQAQQQAQQQMAAQQAQATPEQKQQIQNTQIKITPTVHVTPGVSNRVILNQSTNETKIQMDLAMQATATGPDAPPPGQPSSATATYSMNMDTFVAPSVSGYQEFAQFYRRMAQQFDWFKLPAMNIQIDPRVSEGMSELQRNSDALKGFPMLSYVTMTMAASPDGQQASSQSSAQAQPASQSSASDSNSSDNNIPTSPSAAVMKGLGGLFNKKKQQDNSASQAGAPPANPNSNPNALIEMTTQVSAYSESSLDGGLFDIPAGYTQLQEDPTLVMSGGRAQPQQVPRK